MEHSLKLVLSKIMEQQERILALLEKQPSKPTEQTEYLSEAEAKELLGRKTTWFWEQRKAGRLAYSKIGNRVYYRREDLMSLFEPKDKDK